jgi:hypothetical protein
VLDRAFENPLEMEERATMPFAGGIMQHGYQCGMIWGATLAAGAEAHRRFGPGPAAEAASIRAAQRIVASFRTRHGEINCYEITHIDKSSSNWEMISYFLIKGGTLGCFRMAAWYAPLAFDEINAALAEAEAASSADPAAAEAGADSASDSPAGHGAGPASRLPVSCAAELAKRLGESEEHATMAAGLAGGIGLCGGACGALGAAVWFLGMKRYEEKGNKPKYEDHVRDPRSQELIDGFLRATDFKFECAEIVGRTFESVEDHADFLRDGGCSAVLDALALEPST